MNYHTYVVTNTVTQDAIVCCALSASLAVCMGKQRWKLDHVHILSVLRISPGSYVDV